MSLKEKPVAFSKIGFDALKQVLDNISDACFIINKSGNIIYANQPGSLLLSVGQDKIINADLYDLFSKKLFKLNHTHLPIGEYYSSLQDEWFSINTQPFEKVQIIIVSNITMLKKAGQLLDDELNTHYNNGLDTNLQYRQVIEYSPDSITRWNKDLKLIFANHVFTNKNGLVLAYIRGKDLIEMGQTAELALIWMEKMRLVFETGRPEEHYSSYTRPSGEMYYYLRFAPIFDHNGDVESILVTGRDILEIKKVEQRLKENQELLQSIFDTTLIGMAVYMAVRDEQGIIQDFRIKFYNKEFERLTGRTDLAGKLYAAEFSGIRKMGLFDLMIKVTETGEPGQMEYFYPDDGFNRWLSSMFVKLEDGLVATNLDITERKTAEEKNRLLTEERRLIEERQQLEVLKSTLNSQEEERKRIAESLHNGLGQVLYGVKLSLSQINLENDPASKKALKDTENLLTEAIKESRRISHELMPAILEDFGLKAAIEDICHQFNQLISFHCEFKGKYKSLEKYLQIAIYRIVQELILNVFKHAMATICSLKIEVKPEKISIAVSDNGKGFTAQHTKNRGIGLSNIQNKVKLMNGHIKIKSAEGAGSSILVTIPHKNIDRK